MRSLLAALLATALAFATGACAASPGGTQPPDVRYGRSVCDGCGMIISDERFACGYVLASGASRIFDDVGEMTAELRERRPADATVFLHDYETTEWIRAESAVFVYSGDIRSPMGGGLAAFAGRERAEALAMRYATTTMTWEQVMARAGTPVPGH